MDMTEDEEVALALSIIFGTFFVVAVSIIVYFIVKHYRRSYSVSARYESRGAWKGTSPLANETERDGSLASFLVPLGVELLRSCKSVANRVTSIAIDECSRSQRQEPLSDEHVVDITEAAKALSPRVDELAESVYPPVVGSQVLSAAQALVNAVDELVFVARKFCPPEKLSWVAYAQEELYRDLQDLTDKVEYITNVHS
eukprot:m.53798 g.53798  ORF g.53798 m.53798 type:complete len:199 (+) comp15444_c0_seq1:78-674(+)